AGLAPNPGNSTGPRSLARDSSAARGTGGGERRAGPAAPPLGATRCDPHAESCGRGHRVPAQLGNPGARVDASQCAAPEQRSGDHPDLQLAQLAAQAVARPAADREISFRRDSPAQKPAGIEMARTRKILGPMVREIYSAGQYPA